MQAKIVGKPSYAGSFPGYDEYVPMVDKPVDVSWKKQVSLLRPYASKGTLPLPETQKTPDGIRAQVLVAIVTFFMTLFTLFHSVAGRVIKKLPETQSDQNTPALTLDATEQEEFHPPSPTPVYAEADLDSSLLKRLGELEEKVDTLQSKPSEMPYEKAKLLNAAVCCVDALEAELIATKKALYEALMRQEELLAYIDRQEEAKLWKSKFCW